MMKLYWDRNTSKDEQRRGTFQKKFQPTLATKKGHDELHRLQNALGNRAFGRLLQAKLVVGGQNDRYEQEANRVANLIAHRQQQVNIQSGEAAGPVLEVKPQFETRLNILRGSGQSLAAPIRTFFELRFGRDLRQVQIHTGEHANELSETLNARAFTMGNDLVFGSGEYAPQTIEGRELIAHELTHVVQHQGPGHLLSVENKADNEKSSGPDASHQPGANFIRREPVFPDDSCETVQSSIEAAWPTSKRWVQNARRRLSDPASVANALQRHFKIDPNDASHAGDLETVQNVFRRMEELFDTDIDNRCNPANADEGCQLPDGRKYAAFVHAGRPQDGITHCRPSADVGFLSRRPLIDTLVHEVAHLADPLSTDFAYRDEAVVTTYDAMTRAQAIRNGDSYSEFARDMFMGPSRLPLVLNLSTGVLLSSGRPRWAISASYDIRSGTGIEIFDLVGGVHGFIALDVAAGPEESVLREFGGILDFGIISRSADTHLFADTRLGGFVTTDIAREEPTRAGVTASSVIGWADHGFRAGVNLRLLYDFMSGNNAVIIGGEFNWGP